MRTKIILVVLVMSAVISLAGAATVFYVFSSQSGHAVDTAVLNEDSGNSGDNAVSASQDGTTAASLDQTTTTDTPGEETLKPDQEKPEPLKIFASGDINLGRGVAYWTERKPNRYAYTFEKVADIYKNGDIVFGNLEEPITDSNKSLTGKIILKNKPEAINGLNYAGFNLLSLANNHILDYYETGLFDTMDILKKNNIAFAGAGKNLDEARSITVIEKKGMKIGLLAYTDMADITYAGNPRLSFAAAAEKSGVAPNKLEYVLEDIKKYRSSVDLLIVSLHWGVEYSEGPKPEQVNAAHQILDQGADMIIGHHTHKYQGVEIYNGKPIFYSLGNLIFDQNDPECQQGFIMEIQYNGNKLSALSGIPYKIIGKSQIVPQSGNGAKELFDRQTRISAMLNSKCRVEDGKLVFELD